MAGILLNVVCIMKIELQKNNTHKKNYINIEQSCWMDYFMGG